MPLPNLFVVGAPKAGTTSVYDYLHQHPEIYMSRVKEPHFFSWEEDGWPRWAVKGREAYEALFAEAGDSAIRGEASTWYLYSKTAARRIREAVPDAKVIVLLRSPAIRAYSNWSSNSAKGREPAGDFESALAAEEVRLQRPGPWHYHYFHAGLYHDQVLRYFEVLGRENVLVLLYEELRADPRAVMREAYSFLGVDADFAPHTDRVHNKSYLVKSTRLSRLVEGRGAAKRALKRVLPRTVRTAVKLAARAANKKPRPSLDPALRARLNRAYAPDVERLETLLQRELKSVWF